MLGEPDPRPCEPGAAGGGCCVRGTVGCDLEHDGAPVVSAWGTAAVLNTSGRTSGDFPGCVE